MLALLRSKLQGELLARVYLSRWDTEVSISDLARELGAPVATVHREVARLLEAGLLAERRSGRSRLLSAPEGSPLTRPLTELLAATFGPLPVLTELLADIPGIEHAFIYGSWASRYAGEAGPVPNDVDVLVVGSADPDALDELAEQATKRLRRDVNIRRISPARWHEPGDDPFLTTVRSRAMVALTPDTSPGSPPAEEPETAPETHDEEQP